MEPSSDLGDYDDYEEVLTFILIASNLFKMNMIGIFELRQIILDILVEFE